MERGPPHPPDTMCTLNLTSLLCGPFETFRKESTWLAGDHWSGPSTLQETGLDV